MTPRFAAVLDPILLHVFSLLERIDEGIPIAPAEEKRTLESLIREADGQAAAFCEHWEVAKYSLVSWIDEMLVDAHIWPGQNWWRENVLEWSIFNSRRCNDLYYVNAKETLKNDSGDTLQLSYVCVLLGFRGLYRDPTQSRGLIDKYGLPEDLNAWTAEFSNAVSQARQRLSDAITAQECERSVVTAIPFSRSRLVWPWLIAIILAGLNVLFF
ncbi:MAG: type IV secretion protein DotU [Rhodopirellula sp.]|nr:type IV secretion protein DotU [Rhodopirellula sp.]